LLAGSLCHGGYHKKIRKGVAPRLIIDLFKHRNTRLTRLVVM
jgi:hypothetical protein